MNYNHPDAEALPRELARLAALPVIPLHPTLEGDGFSSAGINDYLTALRSRSKPETAAEDLCKTALEAVASVQAFRQIAAGGGAVDFTLHKYSAELRAHTEKEARVGFEIKPLFTGNAKKDAFIPNILGKDDFYKDQILKYLKSFEYVALTNLNEVRLYSRTSVRGTFNPFYTTTFPEFLATLAENPSVWDAFRRYEDIGTKTNLDAIFFTDLKSWVNAFDVIQFDLDNKTLSKLEAVILLINKIIFIRTAEDYKLVEFNYLKETYDRFYKQYSHRNKAKVFERFFDDIEEFFYEHYNTDLFAERFWQYIEKSDENVEKFMNVFESVAGLRVWDVTLGNGLLNYNYRQIDEDIFGKAYETFIAEARKDSGIYYTPRPLTQYITRSIVQSVCAPLVERIMTALDKNAPDFALADTLMQEFYALRFVDIASGSGSFLVKTLRELHEVYKQLSSALDWTQTVTSDNLFALPAFIRDAIAFRVKHFDDPVLLGMRIALRHIYAADYDERALETAKTNIWKEAIKITPESYRFRRIIKSHNLPNLSLNFARGDALLDASPADDALLSALAEHCGDEIRALHDVRTRYIENPFAPEILEGAAAPKLRLRQEAIARISELNPDFAALAAERRPLIAAVEFFFCFFASDGSLLPREKRGFQGMLSNPPWEVVKPIAKEFADVGKYSISKNEFDKHFETLLKNDEEFAENWAEYRAFYDSYRAYIRGRYPHQGGGDLNYFKVFLEHNLELLQDSGRLGILIPSGIQTDRECADLRHLLLDNYTLEELSSFENKGYEDEKDGKIKRVKLFPEVHPQYKFSILLVKNVPPSDDHAFRAKFYMHDPVDLTAKEPIPVNISMIRKFSPVNYSIMEFRSETDYALCAKIRNGADLLGELGYVFHREFHMTDDAWLFKPDKHDKLPLFEGKMIHQLTTTYAAPRFFINEEEARKELIGGEISRIRQSGIPISKDELPDVKQQFENGNLRMEYEFPRLVYRAIASSTNERTLITAIIPENVFLGNSLNYLERVSYYLDVDGTICQRILPDEDIWFICALLNSLTLNFFIRSKVSANLNMFYIYELPIPAASEEQKTRIAELARQIQAGKDGPHPYLLPVGEGAITTEQKDTNEPSPTGRGQGEGKLSTGLTHHGTSHVLPEALLAHARTLRQQQTDAETLLWSILRDRQLHNAKFRRQHPFEQYILDFFCVEAALAIELDGGGHTQPEQQEYDENRTAILVAAGIKVVRFWNNEVMNNTEGVLRVIWEELVTRLPDKDPHPYLLPMGEGAVEIEKEGLKEPSPTGRGLGEGLAAARVEEGLKEPSPTGRGLGEGLTAVRAELEILIARDLYGLTSEEWAHLCSTFTYGEGETRAELDEIIRLSARGW